MRSSVTNILLGIAALLLATMVISFTLVGVLWTRVNELESLIDDLSFIVNLNSSSIVGVLNETHGGTGHSHYNTGEVLIGNDAGGLTASTLTGGNNIGITNGNGSITISLIDTVPVIRGGTGQITYDNGELLVGTSVGNTLVKTTLTAGPGVFISNGPGEIIIGTTGLNTTIENGTNIAIVATNDSITISLTGVIDPVNGGTGQYVYNNGQLLIGNSLGSLSKNTLTGSTNIAITNGDGTITIAITGVIPTNNGGTGQTTYTSGQVLVGNSGGGLTKTTLTAGSNIAITNGDGAITISLTGVVPTANGGTGQLTYTDGQILVGTSAGNTLVKTTLTAGAGISIVNGPGTITISSTSENMTIDAGTNIDVSTVGSTVTISLTGIINPINGGTGFDTYTDGQLLIGSSSGNTLAKSTLTAGAGIQITNGPGTITISSTGTNVSLVGGTNIDVSTVGPTVTIGLTGTVATTNGGTGQITYNDGEILVGTSSGNTLAKTTLTAGAGIQITNGPGTITVSSTGTNITIAAGTNIDVSTVGATVTIGLTGTVATANGGTGQITYSAGQLLIGNSGGSLTKATLSGGTNIGITNGNGAITVSLTGTVATANGGTGQTTYSNGQLLIGTNTGNTLVKATLTAGTGIQITNGAGAITISATAVNITIAAGANIVVDTVGSTVTIGLTGIVPVVMGGSGQNSFSNGQVLIGNAVGSLTKTTLTPGTNIGITNGNGAITIAVTGTIATSLGGTGQTTYTNGQVLIGNTGGGLTKTTLTAGTNIGITNGNGAITIAFTGVLAQANGGTGFSSYSYGQILMADDDGNLQKVFIASSPSIGAFITATDVSFALVAPVTTANGGTGQTTYSNGQLLIGNTGGSLTKSTLTAGTNIAITNGNGAITIALTGTVATANGGTGQTTYTNGQLLIGTSTGNTLAKGTLTAGTGISITNGAGSITVATTGLQVGLKTWAFYETQPLGTSAPASINGFQTRQLNTIQTNGGSDVTLNTGTYIMTFTPGTYFVQMSAPAFNQPHQLVIVRTAGGVLMYCTSESLSGPYVGGVGTRSVCSGFLTFASTDTVILRHYTFIAQPAGLGVATSYWTEVYAQASIVKIA